MLKFVLLFVIIGTTAGIPIHFSSNSRPIINSQKKIEIPNDECGICNYIVAHSNLTTEKNAIHTMKNVCETLPRKIHAKCMNMIQEHSKQIIRMILKKEDSNIICSEMHICSIPQKTQKNITDCTFCKYASIRIDGFLNKNHTLYDLINFAENFCEDVSENYYESCSSLMNIYYFEIIEQLMDRTNPIDACEAVKLCGGEN
jgi:saposin